MSTASKSFRYQLKELSISGNNSQQTVLSVANDSPFMIFIMQLFAIRDNNQISVERFVSNGVSRIHAATVLNKVNGDTSLNLSTNARTDYVDYANYIPEDELEDFNTGGPIRYQARLLLPNDRLMVNSNVNAILGVKYAEVYFGGISQNF